MIHSTCTRLGVRTRFTLQLQNHIETFENTLSEHKCAKLIAFETYFRAVETQLHSFHGSIKGLGER